jgi:hypothetical protein
MLNEDREGRFSFQFTQRGSAASPNYLVLDLGQEYTFNSLFAFTAKDHLLYPGITRIAIDVSSDGQLNTASSPNWTSVNYTNAVGESVGQVNSDGYLVMSNANTPVGGDATIGYFSPVTARYIRIRCFNPSLPQTTSRPYLYMVKLFNGVVQPPVQPPVEPPVEPPTVTNTNFTSATSVPTFKIGDSRDFINTEYIGPSVYSTDTTLSTSTNWIPYAAFVSSSLEQVNLTTRDPGKANANATTFTGGGSSAAPFNIVIDLGEVRTFNQARFYQTFSDGKTTHIRLDVSSDGNLNTRTSSNWTPVTLTNASGTAVGQVDANGYLVMDNDQNSSGTVASFANITARYIRVRLYNDGRYLNPGYTELYNMKLFLV